MRGDEQASSSAHRDEGQQKRVVVGGADCDSTMCMRWAEVLFSDLESLSSCVADVLAAQTSQQAAYLEKVAAVEEREQVCERAVERATEAWQLEKEEREDAWRREREAREEA